MRLALIVSLAGLIGAIAPARAQEAAQFHASDDPARIGRVCRGPGCDRRNNENAFDIARVTQRVTTADCDAREFQRRHGRPACPRDMAWVCSANWQVNVCVDRELKRDPQGRPQGNVQRAECIAWCAARGRRLPSNNEWLAACEGTRAQSCLRRDITHPITARLRQNESWSFRGVDCRVGNNAWASCMGDPTLNRRYLDPASRRPVGMPNAAELRACVSRHGARNMVGVLGQWVSDTYAGPTGGTRGQFNGGLYPQPRSSCNYTTVAHPADYADYSIGCRCGANVASDISVRRPQRSAQQRNPR